MRTRLVIPAALLVAAAYVKGRQDSPPAHGMTPPACEVSDEVRRRAEAEAADAAEIAADAGVLRPDAPTPARAASESAATLAPPRPVRAGAGVWDAPEFPIPPRRPVAAATPPVIAPEVAAPLVEPAPRPPAVEPEAPPPPSSPKPRPPPSRPRFRPPPSRPRPRRRSAPTPATPTRPSSPSGAGAPRPGDPPDRPPTQRC